MAVFGILLGSKQKITAFNGLIPRALLVFLLPSQPLTLTAPGLASFLALLLVFGADVGQDQHSSITYMIVGRKRRRSSTGFMAEIKFNNRPSHLAPFHLAK